MPLEAGLREQARSTNLRRLLAPTSVAVVGASTAPDKAGHQALLALGRFAGDVYPINPKTQEILGRRAFPSLRALARPVDLVLFAIPARACVEALREAIECEAGGGLIVSGGFAESGEEGAAIQAELEALCANSTFRLLGPNTAGFVNQAMSLTACFVAGASRLPFGNVGVVAQSAGVNLTLSFLLAKLGFGVSVAVGLGNAVDVQAADLLRFLADHSSTQAIALHLEGVQHGRLLYETLRVVTPKKPVIVLTVGKEDVAEFAQSHTGNLLGSYALRVAALRQAGAVVVDSTEELAAAAAALSLARLPAKLRPGIGVLTAQAGPGLLLLDQLKARRVSVPSLAVATVEQIAQHLPPLTYQKNPIDTGRPGSSFSAVFQALAQDASIDAVAAFVLDEPAAFAPAEILPAVARRVGKPVLFGTAGLPEDLASSSASLRANGIFVAGSPEALARATIALVEDASLQARLARGEQAPAVGETAALPVRRDEQGAKQWLEALGVPIPKGFACVSHAEAEHAFGQLAKPVVLKILSSEIQHKTDVGGVQLNIVDERGLNFALARLDRIPLGSARSYLLEEMAPAGFEVIVGAVRDPSFGPSVMLGAGGIFAEALKDSTSRLAPLTLDEAEEMIGELRVATIFEGWRGGPALDKRALARVIVTLGHALCRQGEISTVEINPLRVYPEGVLALDALLV
ncbi:MAG TPA: acetate--CoA ligase family protein [Polyangiaceae bacterium]|nr:acetate--CoA ligase family protein [Polyangiaceae bacterium]